MRGILIAALVAGTVGLVGTSPTLAAPITGTVLQGIAAPDTQNVRWWRHCRHSYYSHRWCHRRWW
jgi:hypothetical protein